MERSRTRSLSGLTSTCCVRISTTLARHRTLASSWSWMMKYNIKTVILDANRTSHHTRSVFVNHNTRTTSRSRMAGYNTAAWSANSGIRCDELPQLVSDSK